MMPESLQPAWEAFKRERLEGASAYELAIACWAFMAGAIAGVQDANNVIDRVADDA